MRTYYRCTHMGNAALNNINNINMHVARKYMYCYIQQH